MVVATDYWGYARFGNRVGLFVVKARFARESDVAEWFPDTLKGSMAAMQECGRRNRAL